MNQILSSSKERLQKAIECKSSDRIPISIRLEYAAAFWSGLKFGQFADDPWSASEAIESIYDKIGGWDAVDASWTLGTRWSKLEAANVKFPDADFSEQTPHRIEDSQVMKPDDYRIVMNRGIYHLISIMMARLGKRFNKDIEQQIFTSFSPIYKHWDDKGPQIYRGGMVRIPFVQFSMWRTWRGIAQDILRRRKILREACEASCQEMIEMGENQSRAVGCNFIFIPCGRASATFLSNRLFHEFFFPNLRETVEKLVRNGFTPRLHCDTDWTPFLQYFLELPKKKCILELSHMTDINYAKDLLGGHMCLSGDVPQNLLSAGSQNKVESYCKNLIENVGSDGFILANEDIIPYNARFENVKTLIDTGKKFG
jgi:hypothetical protein